MGLLLNMHRLRLLRELSRRGTITDVANALSYSPSAVSQQLRLLESETGVRLMESVGRRVRLTPLAERLARHTDALLERMEEAEADLAAALNEVTGVLRVATFQTAGLALIPQTLSHLSVLHPDLVVRMAEIPPERSLSALDARDFDIVLGEEYPGLPHTRHPQVERENLFHDALRLVRPIGSSGPAHCVDLSRVASRPWVMEPEGNAARLWATAMCRESGFEPQVRYESADLLLHVRLVESGHAVAVLPDLVWFGRSTSAEKSPLPDGPKRQIFTAVRRGAGQHPAIRAFRESLRRSVDDLPEQRNVGASDVSLS